VIIVRWAHFDRLPNVLNVMNRFHVLDRTIDRNRVKMAASGSPCTYWRNTAVSSLIKRPSNELPCYCWVPPQGCDTSVADRASPDRGHFLCMGTGILGGGSISGIGDDLPAVGGYQKYGYVELTISTPSEFTRSSNNIVISGKRGSKYVITGDSTVESLTTERYELYNFKDVNHFLINEAIDPDQNRIEYEYTTDDSNWVQLTLSPYTDSKLANKKAEFNLPEGTEYIRFRITLRKRYSRSQSPRWNSIRFRYRIHKTLYEIDSRFNIHVPAFLAARQAQTKEIEQGEYGWKVKFPLDWWVLPEADIQDTDVMMFLQGLYANYRFQIQNVKEYVYGQYLQLLHKDFRTELIRDKHSLLGIIHFLI